MPDDLRNTFTYYGKTPTGVEMALTLDVAADSPPAEIVSRLKDLDLELKKVGFTRSDRLDKPAYGAGGGNFQKKPETPAPPDLEIPSHCDQLMKYVPAREEGDGKKAVAAHWDCRKGRGCAEPRTVGENTFPFTNWHLTKKKPDAMPAKASGSALTADASKKAEPADRPMTGKEWTEFWTKARAMSYDVPTVLANAGVDQEAFTKWTKVQVHDLFVKLKDLAEGKASA
jgi:hypothetical protein